MYLWFMCQTFKYKFRPACQLSCISPNVVQAIKPYGWMQIVIQKVCYTLSWILQLVTHFVGPRCYNVSFIFPEDDLWCLKHVGNMDSVN